MKIAILGGAFDPPHIGHYLVATQVKEILQMDEVWLMPCYSYFPEFPVKFSHITTPEMRLEMTRLVESQKACLPAGRSKVESCFLKVSRFEFEKNKQSRTIDTLRMLEKEYPQHTFSWIIGSDTLPHFHLWNEWQSLVADHNLIIFPRDTDFKTLESRVRDAFQLSEIPQNIKIIEGNVVVSNIASTHIRKRIRQELPIISMVIPEVEEYIAQHHLYKLNQISNVKGQK